MNAIRNKLIVSVEDTVEKSETGIIIDRDKKPDRGVVVSKGNDVTAEIEIGDVVVFSEYGGKSIQEKGVEYVTLNEGEVYFVIKK